MGMIGSLLNAVTGSGDGAPAPAPPPPSDGAQPYNPSFLASALRWLTVGGDPMDAPAEERAAHYEKQYQAAIMSRLPQLMSTLPPSAQAAVAMGGPGVWSELAKNLAPQTRSAGQSTDYWGGQPSGGYTNSTDTYGIEDKSGQGYEFGPGIGGVQATGPQFGGDYTAKDGLVLSGRTGLNGGATYQLPETVAGDLKGFQPQPAPIGGAPPAPGPAGGGAPGAAAPPGGPMPAQVPPVGIRNNNFGNVSALSGGKMWNGQVGTDGNGRAIFATPEDGIAAAQKNLAAYSLHHGINTLAGVADRWARNADGSPAAAGYLQTLSQAVGVGPNDKIDLQDPRVQQLVLKGIFTAENGAPAMQAAAQAFRARQEGQGAPPATLQPAVATGPAPGPQPASMPGNAQPSAANPQGPGPIITGGESRVNTALTPQERQAAHISPFDTRPYIHKPDGTIGPLEPEYDASWAKGQRELFANTEAYKQNDAAQAALQALNKNAGHLSGPAAYSILDTFARTINPGAVARQGTLAAIEESLGLPGKIIGGALKAAGKGQLPLSIQQQLVDAVTPFAQAHWDQAKQAYDANVALGAQHGFKEGEMTMPIGSRPERALVTPNGSLSPSQAQAQAGALRAQARQAIASGASRGAVIQRLQDLGVSSAGL